ncbi:MAG: DUF5683 domain-containing protein [Bacteroidales bacterium]|nr:DUF5683 domain-containing protein [Bacteroidales bacterium]
MNRIFWIILFLLSSATAWSQEEATPVENIGAADTITIADVVLRDSMVTILPNGDKLIKSHKWGAMGHSPHTATMYAAVLPGLGQIYNGKYWKLPILYGGIGALCYAIHFNNKKYVTYKNAYRDFLIGDPNNKSYEKLIKKTGLTLEEIETTHRSWFQGALKSNKDYFRRYRDLSYFGLIGLYVIQIVDAAVDAHFFKFDVSDDLSLEWQPTIVPDMENKSLGASLCITF